MSHRWLMAVAVLSLAACNGDSTDKDTDGTTDTTDTGTTIGSDLITDLTIVPNEVIPGVARVTFETTESGDAVVWFGPSGELDQSTPVSTGTSHDVLVLGAKSGEMLEVQVELTTADGTVHTSAIAAEVLPVVQPELPSFTLDAWNPELACTEGGFMMFSSIGQSVSSIGILDRDGDYVWSKPNDVPDTLIGRARPASDGSGVLWNVAHEDRVDDLAHIYRTGWEGDLLAETRTEWGHHDFVELPSGTEFGWLGYDFQSMIVGMQTDPWDVAVDTIAEGPEGETDTTSTVTIWNLFDDYPWEPWYVGPEMNEGTFLPGYHEFSHGNSLMYRESDDSYFMMFRWLDALVKVDRATGDFVWQMGGRDNMFTATSGDDSDFFFHAHMSEIWDGGMMVFDNQDPAVMPSRLVEYSFDETNMTLTKEWEYVGTRNEALLGDVRRVPVEGCDNVIVSWSAQGRIAEMTRAGETVWEVSAGIGQVTSRIFFIPDLYDAGVAADWNP